MFQPDFALTVVIRSLAECHELYNRIIHLQHSDGLAMHDC